jgi:pilus assembly protein FimV
VKNKRLSLAVLLALSSPAAWALGLGALEVKSGLNQPLVAEIPILSATPGELESLQVRLAAPDAFERVGLPRPTGLAANLQLAVGRNARGLPVIRVTTGSRFNEPFLTFLIEAEWGRGAVVREYSALVDPPHIAPATLRPLEPLVAAPPPAPLAPPAEPMPTVRLSPEPAPPVVSAPEPAPVQVEAPPPVASEPMPAPMPPPPVASSPMPRPAPQPAPVFVPPPPPPTAVYGPMPSVAPSAPATTGEYGPVQRGQTLWSIASQMRPDAGVTVQQMMLAILRSNPEAFDGDNINRLRAGAVLRLPSRDEALAVPAESAAALARAQMHQRAERPAQAPPPAPATAAAPARSEPPAPRAAARPAGNNRARLEIVPPANTTADRRGVQSGSTAGAGGTELRTQLIQAREDLAAKEAEIVELRSRVSELENMGSDRQRLIDVQNAQLEALKARVQELENERSGAAPAADAGGSEPLLGSVDAPASSNAPAAQAPAQAEPRPAASPPQDTGANAEEAPWYMSPYVLGGAGLVLLLGLVALLRRGRRPAEAAAAAPAPRSSLRAEEMFPKPKLGGAAPEPASDAGPSDSALAERERAVAQRPRDADAHLELLRYLHSQGDAGAFEKAAMAMRQAIGTTLHPRWREAVVLGSSLLPGHPLFSQASWNAPKFAESATPADPVRTTAPSAAARPAEPAAAAPSPVITGVMSAPKPAEPPAPAPAPPRPAPAAPAPPPVAPAPRPAPVAAAPAPRPEPEPEISFEAPELTAADISGHDDDPSKTSLELAQAYLEMGDLDGARSMLQEVAGSGGAWAKAEAERLLREIG